MTREAVHTDEAPAAIGPYSQAVRLGSLLFCSGQIALHPKTGALVGEGDVEAQTERVMENLVAVLRAGGASLETTAKITIFLKSMDDFGKVNAIYARWFDGVVPPARACVEVARLPKDVLVEIDAVAGVTTGS